MKADWYTAWVVERVDLRQSLERCPAEYAAGLALDGEALVEIAWIRGLLAVSQLLFHDGQSGCQGPRVPLC